MPKKIKHQKKGGAINYAEKQDRHANGDTMLIKAKKQHRPVKHYVRNPHTMVDRIIIVK
jgi:hypothetical protein